LATHGVGPKVGPRVLIPYSKVTAVSYVSDKSIMGKHFSSSSIAVSVGDRDYSVDFRGSDKARHTHEIILWHITR
jgi:hypothetical protein